VKNKYIKKTKKEIRRQTNNDASV